MLRTARKVVLIDRLSYVNQLVRSILLVDWSICQTCCKSSQPVCSYLSFVNSKKCSDSFTKLFKTMEYYIIVLQL